jgi:hypothetical protein
LHVLDSHVHNLAVLGLSAVEGALKSKRVKDVELSEDNYSACLLLLLLNSEGAVREAEDGVSVAAEQRQDAQLGVFDSAFVLKVFEGTSVHKAVLLARVAVHVCEEQHFAFRVHESDEGFCIKDLWVQKLVRRLPLAVKVASEQRASVVAVDYAVRVEHRDNSKYEMFPQLGCLRSVLEQHGQRAIKHETSLWLARVHSRSDYNALLGRVVFQVVEDFTWIFEELAVGIQLILELRKLLLVSLLVLRVFHKELPALCV